MKFKNNNMINHTGIYTRCQINGKFKNVDIAQLSKENLMSFLRCRGGENEYAENAVLCLLGHINDSNLWEKLHSTEEKDMLSLLRSEGGENSWAENTVGIILFKKHIAK